MDILKKISLLFVFSTLSGCLASVSAPENFDLNLSPAKDEVFTVETPDIGVISIAELGDTLVSKHEYSATPRFMLTEPHIISKSGDKRAELKDHCWIQKLPKGYYTAKYESREYIFYYLADNSTTASVIPCESGDRSSARFGFLQSKTKKNEYRPWYFIVWNINGILPKGEALLDPIISEKGIFKREFYYNGKTGSQLKFSYREFTEDGMARDSFTQDVVYDLSDGSIIGFKGAKFEIINATNTKVTYKVISYFK